MYSSNTHQYWMNIYMIFVQYIPCTDPVYICICPIHTYIGLKTDIMALCICHVWANIIQYIVCITFINFLSQKGVKNCDPFNPMYTISPWIAKRILI